MVGLLTAEHSSSPKMSPWRLVSSLASVLCSSPFLEHAYPAGFFLALCVPSRLPLDLSTLCPRYSAHTHLYEFSPSEVAVLFSASRWIQLSPGFQQGIFSFALMKNKWWNRCFNTHPSHQDGSSKEAGTIPARCTAWPGTLVQAPEKLMSEGEGWGQASVQGA